MFGDFIEGIPLRSGVIADEAMNALVEISNQNYTAMLRFRLVDKKRRSFVAQRFCFLGSIDDWIFLSGPENLKTLVGRDIRLLGTEEFFNLPDF